jgi:hypothetical protein
MLIMQDRKEPSAQIGPGLPQMLFGNRADETALHEIVSARGIPGQSPRIAAQAGDFGLDEAREIGHQVHPFCVPALGRFPAGGWPPI